MAQIRLHRQHADGHLPMVCMHCGALATHVESRSLTWYPWWVCVFILLSAPGMVLAVLVALALRREATLQAPLCNRHKDYWATRWALHVVATLLAFIAALGLLAMCELLAHLTGQAFDRWLAIGEVSVLGSWPIGLAIIYIKTIRASKITRTHVTLANVSDVFVDAVLELDADVCRRLRKWEQRKQRECQITDRGAPTDRYYVRDSRPTDTFSEHE